MFVRLHVTCKDARVEERVKESRERENQSKTKKGQRQVKVTLYMCCMYYFPGANERPLINVNKKYKVDLPGVTRRQRKRQRDSVREMERVSGICEDVKVNCEKKKPVCTYK